jgi:hypothetical protein
MAYIIADGFDFYTESLTAQAQLTNMGPWTATNYDMGIRDSTKTRFGVGRSLSWRDSAWVSKYFDNVIGNTIYISFSFYFDRAQDSSVTFFRIYLYDATGTQATVTFLANGTIQLRRGEPDSNVVVASFPSAFSSYAWQHFQIKVVIDDTNGSIAIRKNGSTTDTYSATGLNSKGSSTTTIRSMLFFQGWYYFQTYMDDLFVNDDSGPTNNTWPGDIRCYSLSPTSAGDTTEFTPTPTQANYLNVNETAPNTTNYNSSTVIGATDLFNIADLPTAPATIHTVVARTVAAKSDAGTRLGAVVIKSGTTVSPGTDKVLSTTHTGVIQPYATNPDTGEPWAFGSVNSLQIGYKVSG